MTDLIFKTIADTVSNVIGRVLPPEKISEEEKLRIKIDTETALRENSYKLLEKEVEDRVSARKLAGQDLRKGNPFTTCLAALHRPIWSFVTLFLFSWTIIGTQFGFSPINLTDVHQNILMTVIVFYFGGRSVEKVMGKEKN